MFPPSDAPDDGAEESDSRVTTAGAAPGERDRSRPAGDRGHERVHDRVRVAALEAEVDLLEEERDALQRKVTALEATVEQLADEVTALENDVERETRRRQQVIDHYEYTVTEMTEARRELEAEHEAATASDDRSAFVGWSAVAGVVGLLKRASRD